MNQKISIIVPVYKVEQYLHKCVDSILAQTFTDFELILVDDGSPDNCGKICDEYATKDSRIKVIHKENGGLSDARNAGLDSAIGDYVGFVDSDDYIENDMYELLYDICINNNCEISSCSSIIHFKNKTVVNGGHPITIHTKEEAMKTMLEGKLYDEVVWVKLFKRDLFEDVRFPVGRIYEDTAVTYKLIDKSHKVGCIGEAKYNYIKRDGSVMDNAIKNIKLDAVYTYKDMYEFIAKRYPQFIDLVVLKLSNNCMIVLNLMLRSNNFEKYKNQYYEVSKILNNNFKRAIKLDDYPRNVKILLRLNNIHPNLYKVAINTIDRKR